MIPRISRAHSLLGFLVSSGGKESACNAGDLGSITGVYCLLFFIADFKYKPCSLSLQQLLSFPTLVIFTNTRNPCLCFATGNIFCWKYPSAGYFHEGRARVFNLFLVLDYAWSSLRRAGCLWRHGGLFSCGVRAQQCRVLTTGPLGKSQGF